MYNYIGIINKSSAVNHSLSCNFLNSQSKLNLILAKSNIIEIYNISRDGLESTPYLNLYGRVILIEKIPQNTSDTNTADNLFILTENLDFCIIQYIKTKNEIVNVDKGSVKEDIGKRQDKVLSVFCANRDYAIISAYKNIFKIIFLKNRTKHEDYSVRYEYEDILFLFRVNNYSYSNIFSNNLKKDKQSTNENVFGIIKVNSNYTHSHINNKSITLETFTIDNQEIVKDNYCLDLTSDPTMSLIISPEIGGIVIFYSNYLKYYQLHSRSKKILEKEVKSYSDRKFSCYTMVDKFRYLIGDEYGNLFLLAFKLENYNNNNFTQSNSEEYSLILQFLGEINFPSTISYLDNNFIFVGSEQANSQMVRISKTPTNRVTRPFIEIVEEFDNLGPISDFCVMSNNNNNSNENIDEILCASGSYKSSCLKTVRKGTSIISDGNIPLEKVSNIFSVYYNNDNDAMLIDDKPESEQTSSLLFVTMPNQTKILNYNFENNLIEDFPAGAGDICKNNLHKTIFATNIFLSEDNCSYVLQVTTHNLFIYNSRLKMIYRAATYIAPILVKYKKRNKMLYIYNRNNILLRYDVKSLSKRNFNSF